MSPPTPRRRRALPVLTAALAALLCGLAPPAAADGPPDWAARPTGGTDRPYVYLEGTPGTVLQDRLTVTNSGRAPLTVRLRGDGRAGAWIRFAEDTVTLPPRTRAEVPLALTVPDNAVPGDASGEAVATGGGEEIRVPVRVRTIGPTLAALGVEDVEVSGGTIRYALVNRGNAMLRPRLAVRAEGVFGTLLDRPERPLPLELAPGRRVERTEPWPDAPALDAVTVRLRVTASGAPGTRPRPRRRTSRWPRPSAAGCWSSAAWPRSPPARTDDGAPGARPRNRPRTRSLRCSQSPRSRPDLRSRRSPGGHRTVAEGGSENVTPQPGPEAPVPSGPFSWLFWCSSPCCPPCSS